MNEVLSLGLTMVLVLAAIVLFWRARGFGDRETGLVPIAIPSRVVVNRIFAKEDFAYARGLPQPIYRLFLRQRRELALSWICDMRRVSISLMRGHLTRVRSDPSSGSVSEFQMTVTLLEILLLCEILMLAISLAGVLRVKSLVSFLAREIESLSLESSSPVTVTLHASA